MKKPSTSHQRRHFQSRFRQWLVAEPLRKRGLRNESPLRLETLEGRLMLAADPLAGNLFQSEADLGEVVTNDAPELAISLVASDILLAEGEDATAVDLVAFAQALAADGGVTLYGAAWCSACTTQKELFGDGGQFLPFVEVTNPDRSPNEIGTAENITSYPTWEFPDGTREEGVLSLETISARSGVAIPTGTDPFVVAIEDKTVYGGAPLHIGIDGYDPDSGILTYTVTSSDPSLIEATVLNGNRSTAIRFEGWGEFIVQLFEQRAPDASGRFIELAEAGFYDAVNNDPDVTAHRVKDDFMLQFGDPTGTGGGGSDLGDFDDDFHPELQHTSSGVLSFAKGNDDTNDSQVFVTDVPTRYLDFNHSVLGIVTEGDKVRDELTKVDTDDSWRPTTPLNLESVTVFEDTENAALMLRAAEGVSGTATITVTATDEDGNEYVETFDVFVEPDPYDGGPYLDDISPVETTQEVPVEFQITAIDLEGDSVVYGGVTSGDVEFGLEVDSVTGDVTVTPPAGFAGTLVALMYTRQATQSDTQDTFDSQYVEILVVADAPSGVDLVESSDSGSSDTDNVSNELTPLFEVDGVIVGALVELRVGDQVIGQTVAADTTVSITASLAGLGDGSHQVTAVQKIDDVASPASDPLEITVDTTSPAAFTSSATSTAIGEQPWTFDVENPEEGTVGTIYSLLNAPDGMTIDSQSGEMSWQPAGNDAGTYPFSVVLTDLAGNAVTQDFELEVSSSILVAFDVELTDRAGNPISTVVVGDEFDVHVYVSDVGVDEFGVFAAFLDLLYDEQLVAIDGSLSYGADYPNGRIGDLSTAGVVDEAGAVAENTPLGAGKYLVFTVPMQAIRAGDTVLESDPADDQDFNEVLRFGGGFHVPVDQIVYRSAALTIEPAFGAVDDIYNQVLEDSDPVLLEVLENDEEYEGSTGEFIIEQVSSPDQNGTVVITADGKGLEYQPAPDFFGAETFTYTVNDGTGSDTATVTVNVQPQNDDPVATDDEVTVMEDAVDFEIDVLDNDSFDPDVEETLTISAFDQPSAGGQLTLSSDSRSLLYTPPADFFGTSTFTYTVSDGNGGTDEGLVTITVVEQNDPPEAVNDIFDVDEDSTDNSLNVLGNDSTLGDDQETLSIVNVSTPNEGGTVTIAADTMSLIYTPAPDFYGSEVFTYEVSDGNGGFATASVTVRVAGTNDPPVANDDTANVIKDSSDNLISVLENDDSGPDAPESFIVVDVEVVSGGGSAVVASDGSGILYTPAPGNTGDVVLKYTMEDPDGASAEAEVQVTVLEYIPSHLAGQVFLDVNNDGLRGENEAPLGGVVITLTGTDIFDQAVELQATTDAFGDYQFRDLAPGSYEVVQTHPQHLIDGMDRSGDVFYAPGTDTLTVELEQDVDLTHYDFGERGRGPELITVADFFASRASAEETVLAAFGSGQWYSVQSGWTHAQEMSIEPGDTPTTPVLNVTSTEPQEYSTTLNLNAREQVDVLYHEGDDYLVQIEAAPEELFPEADCPCADGGEAEGEAAVLLVGAGDSEGEAAEEMFLDTQVIVDADAPVVPLSVLPLTAGADFQDNTSTTVLMPPTPADAHLATDLLLAEAEFAVGDDTTADPVEANGLDADVDFAVSVDRVLEELLETL